MVSPPAKNGADVIPSSFKTFAAADGNGVAFPAVGAFGEVHGTSTDVQYVSRRDGRPGTSGWSTHGISPAGGGVPFFALALGNVPTFEAAFTPDLTGAIYRSWKSLTVAPNVAGVTNLYRLRDLDASAPQVQLLSAAATPLEPVDIFSRLGRQNTSAAASRDLSHVIFESPWNLTGDGTYSPDHLYEYADGAGLRAVGRIPSGLATECDDAGGPSCVDAPSADTGLAVSTFFGAAVYSTGMMSDDGSRILFQVPAGSPGAIYMRENGTRTVQLNVSELTPPDTPDRLGPAQVWGMSGDGSRVFFTTGDSLVSDDTDGGAADLYMYDVTAPAGSRLTLLSEDRTGNGNVASVVGNSTDGHYVYFTGGGQFVTGEPAVVSHGLYVSHDGVVRYIGRFDSTEILNTPQTAWITQEAARTSRVTPDGRHLLFMSQVDDGFRGRGGYAGYDHGACPGGCRELYLYSADTGRLACVSCNPRSPVATGDSRIDILPQVSATNPTMHLSHALSDDGQHVFFSTAQALVPEDANGKWDAYEYDAADGSVHLLSSGTSTTDSYFLDASPDGRNAFFVTRARLVGWDTDDNYDLYDARVGGGFPDPPPPPPPCAGDGCRAPAAGVPAAVAGASAQFKGAGDLSEKLRKPRKCKGRAVLRRVRGKRKCVHPRSRARRHHARRGHAKSGGRALSERSGR